MVDIRYDGYWCNGNNVNNGKFSGHQSRFDEPCEEFEDGVVGERKKEHGKGELRKDISNIKNKSPFRG